MIKQLSRRHVLTALVAGVAYRCLETPEIEAATSNVDLDTQRYEDLTASEMVSMTVGIPLQDSNPHQAQRIMQLSLDLEHLIAVVPIDTRKVPREQLDRIRLFRTQLEALSGIKVLLHILGDFGRPKQQDEMPAATGRAPLSPTGHRTRFGS